MNDYQGPAVVEIDGGTPEIPVNARLSASRVGGRTDWSGTIQATSNDDLAPLRNLTQGRIRLPSNRTGNFLVTNHQVSSQSPSERIEIMGNGSPPPF